MTKIFFAAFLAIALAVFPKVGAADPIATLGVEAQADDVQFSQNGLFFASHKPGEPRVVVWNVSAWTKSFEFTIPDIQKRKWRVADDGAVWSVKDNVLSHYISNGDHYSLDISKDLPRGTIIAGYGISFRPIPAVFWVSQNSNYLAIGLNRCELGELNSNGPVTSEFCKFKWISPPLDNTRGVISQTFGYQESYSDGVDYYVYRSHSSSHPLYPGQWFSHYQAYAGYDFDYDTLGDRENDYNFFRKSPRLRDYFYEVDGNMYQTAESNTPFANFLGITDEIPGHPMAFSFESSTGHIVVRNFRKNFFATHSVNIPPSQTPPIFSPDGKLFVYNGNVYPGATITDPYYGKSSKIVEDIIMVRITTAIGENKWEEAISSFDELESRGVNLPESFYYYQIDTLMKAGKKELAHQKAERFISNYGDKSSHYARMIEILAQ